MSYSFNLLERPWIPCLALKGTTVVALSIRETLARSHELQGVVHGSPIVSVSVIRILLAVLHRVYGPADRVAWAQLWNFPHFEMAALDGYFDGWRGRFDLFGEERPFYQDASIPAALAGPVSRLAHASASGNNATLFDHSLDGSCSAIPAEEAALQLVTHQTYAVGGFATPDPKVPGSKYTEGSPTVKSALCLVRGDNLHETLLLNLRRYAPAQKIPFGAGPDLPAWERPESASVRTRLPSGWLDLLTWQSRRILLFPGGEATSPSVRTVAILKGESLSGRFTRRGMDSMMAWQRLPNAKQDSDPWIPFGFRAERAVWRDAHSLFASFEDQSTRPPILDWLGELTDETLDETHRYGLDIAGLSTFQAKVLSWHAESLPLPVAILRNPDLWNQVRTALEVAESGEKTLRFAASRLTESLLVPQERANDEKKKPNKKEVSSLRDSPLRLQNYWGQLQIPFQRFVVDLAAGGSESINVEMGVTPALTEWILACRRSALDSMNLTRLAAGEGTRTFRAIAEAESAFCFFLNKELPDPKKKVSENDAPMER